jgi:hypothetical protein
MESRYAPSRRRVRLALIDVRGNGDFSVQVVRAERGPFPSRDCARRRGSAPSCCRPFRCSLTDWIGFAHEQGKPRPGSQRGVLASRQGWKSSAPSPFSNCRGSLLRSRAIMGTTRRRRAYHDVSHWRPLRVPAGMREAIRSRGLSVCELSRASKFRPPASSREWHAFALGPA